MASREVAMELLPFFLEQHARAHAAAMAGGEERTIEDALLDGLSEAQLRRRPLPGVNAIVWLLWHMARSEDVAVNVLLGDGRQVLDEDGWAARLALSQRAMGTGMKDEQVDAVCARIAIDELRAYRIAVGRRTRTVVATLQDDDLDRPIEPQRLLAVDAFVDAEEGARRVAGYWRGRSRRFVLTNSIATHSYLHLGEAGCVRTLLRQPAAPS
jgi:hypothetical protein